MAIQDAEHRHHKLIIIAGDDRTHTYDASNNLLYPRDIKTSRDKELYKKTYLKESKELAEDAKETAREVFTTLVVGYSLLAIFTGGF
tara:strand:- start:106 stop:366 length:261 start_codon:yes stop_codon:yes gene_type:complete